MLANDTDPDDEPLTVTLVDGQILTGVDMVLTPTQTTEVCDQPGAPIKLSR